MVTHDAGHLRMPGRQSDHDRFPPAPVRQRANEAKQEKRRDALVLKMEQGSRLLFHRVVFYSNFFNHSMFVTEYSSQWTS